jgi:sugar (pentulose or hexulose) kinase
LSSTPLLVAIDVGTSGVRATAVDFSARIVCEIRRGYPVSTPEPGWAEQDPRDWTERTIEALGLLVHRLQHPERIVAIGLTGQCPTIAAADANGQPVGPGIMYFDNRAVLQARQMSERVDDAEMHRRTGHVPTAFHAGPKVLWLAEHRPDVFSRAATFLFPRDFVLRRLTGEIATDETHAGTTLFFDLVQRRWADDLLDEFGLAPSLLPRVLAPVSPAGTVLHNVATELGLRPGIPVIIGAADSLCAAFGAGVTQPGPISEMAGSSSCLNSTIPAPLSDVRVDEYPHVLAGRYYTEVGVNTAGAAADWVVRQLEFLRHSTFLEEAERFRARWHERRGGTASPLEIAPLFVPYLGDGERNDPQVRGAFIGLSLRHDRAALAYATLEGLALAVRSVVGMLEGAGCKFDELRVSGGAARYGVASQLKADVLERPVFELDVDATTVGTAMLAGIGADLAADVEHMGQTLLTRARALYPSGWATRVERIRADWYDQIMSSPAVRMPTQSASF